MNADPASTPASAARQLSAAGGRPLTPAAAFFLPQPLADRLGPRTWLILGVVLFALTGQRWGVGVLGWVVPVPFLVYAYRNHGLRARFWLLVALLLAFHLSVLKIVTPPVPVAMVPVYAVPLALGAWIILWLTVLIRRRVGLTAALYAYPALATVSGALAARYSYVGVWGANANTQLENLPLLQLAALSGISTIEFLLAWVASFVAWALVGAERRDVLRHGLVLVFVFLGGHTFGSLRLYGRQGQETARVAAVSSHENIIAAFRGSRPVAPITDELFAHSRTAAQRGAELVVWNEAATVVDEADEEAFLARGVALAREHDIDLVLAYAVPISVEPLRFENKYVWLRPDGSVAETYFKHHPVPGEGSIRGTDPLRAVVTRHGIMAGAICYDYDFPEMVRGHAALGVGLVIVPGSDWQGIDPYHTQMIRMRAIEGGFSVVRSVRWAASAAYDAYGRVRAYLPVGEGTEPILLATVPVGRVSTLYARFGDWVGGAAALFLLFVAVAGVRRWRRSTGSD